MVDLHLTDTISDFIADAYDTDTTTPDDTPIDHNTHDTNVHLTSLSDISEPSIPPATPMLAPPSMSSPLHLRGGTDNDIFVIAPGPSQFPTPHHCHIKTKLHMAV
jgi:hypothetical protein